MLRQDIDLNGYWHIIIVYNAFLGQEDSGFTHTNYNKKLTIVGIGQASSKEEFINTIAHEAKHVQSHICKYYKVDEDSEEAAYLMGYIIMKIIKFRI